MADQKSTGNDKGGGNGDSNPKPAPKQATKACVVNVQGRCNGVGCTCAASGGGR